MPGSSQGSGEAPQARPAGPLSATELVTARTRLIDSFLLPRTQNLTRWVIAGHVASGAQLLADPRITDPEAQADAVIANEVERLRRAALFWVSPDVTALCHAAAPSMPAFWPEPADLPAPYGLMYFAAPLGGYDPFPQPFAAGDLTGTAAAAAERVSVTAAVWGPWDEGGTWPHGGTWFTFYSDPPSDLLDALRNAGPGQAGRVRVPPLMIDNEAACEARADHGEIVVPPGTTASWLYFVLCACRIIISRRASVEPQPVPRSDRRRSERAGVAVPGEPVQLVDIRVRRQRASSAPPGPDAEQRRGPQVRFPVQPHWRQQWYPRSQVHRPILIDGYDKGPEGAPYRAPKRVYLLRQPGEPAGPQARASEQELEP